jgi:demethylmenaquinone methyltransferase / 2-methoxy-6-polyprenyl-1,4-benzoquinol methylase
MPAPDGLRDALSSPEAKRIYVRRLFATIADRYDFITVVLSYGQDQRWKRRLVDLARIRVGTRVLDLACGTGDIALAAAARGGSVTGLDITERMVELARRRNVSGRPPARFLVGDMAALPFGDEQFDVVTTGYGIRNVPEIEPAIREIKRVLRPGGVLLSLDFNRPDSRTVRAVYMAYLTAVGSALGFLLHGDPDTYRYIAESIRRYPGAEAVRGILEANGFRSTRYLPVLGGLMAIHRAEK